MAGKDSPIAAQNTQPLPRWYLDPERVVFVERESATSRFIKAYLIAFSIYFLLSASWGAFHYHRHGMVGVHLSVHMHASQWH